MIKFKGFYGVHDRLMVFDPLAIKEVLSNMQVFEKPLLLRKFLGEVMGHGKSTSATSFSLSLLRH